MIVTNIKNGLLYVLVARLALRQEVARQAKRAQHIEAKRSASQTDFNEFVFF